MCCCVECLTPTPPPPTPGPYQMVTVPLRHAAPGSTVEFNFVIATDAIYEWFLSALHSPPPPPTSAASATAAAAGSLPLPPAAPALPALPTPSQPPSPLLLPHAVSCGPTLQPPALCAVPCRAVTAHKSAAASLSPSPSASLLSSLPAPPHPPPPPLRAAPHPPPLSGVQRALQRAEVCPSAYVCCDVM